MELLPQIGDKRTIKGIHPEHGAIGFIDMTMPVPAGGKNKVAGLHLDRLPLHDRHRCFAFDDETDGIGRMAMAGRFLSGEHHLYISRQCVRRRTRFTKRGIDELDHTPVRGRTRLHQFACSCHEGPDVRPTPVTGGIRRGADVVSSRHRVTAPQGIHALVGEVAVEGFHIVDGGLLVRDVSFVPHLRSFFCVRSFS